MAIYAVWLWLAAWPQPRQQAAGVMYEIVTLPLCSPNELVSGRRLLACRTYLARVQLALRVRGSQKAGSQSLLVSYR